MSNYVSEKQIRNTLRGLAKQRVAMILQPGDVWVIERAIASGDTRIATALRTCYMRGWVEILKTAVPIGKLKGEGDNLHFPDSLDGIAPMYRLTQSGWEIIHNSHTWVIVTLIVASATLIATIVGILLSAGGLI